MSFLRAKGRPLLAKGWMLPAVAAAMLVPATPARPQSADPAPPPSLQQRGETVLPHVEPPAPLTGWQRSHLEEWARDFAGLDRYRAADRELGDPAAQERRVIFFGDSITDRWDLARSFPGRIFINRGVSGQTTSQMLLRFRQDVIDLKPDVVLILAGTNDIAGNTGPISLPEIEGNLSSMAELARVHHIALVLSSVTPVNNYTAEAQPLFASRPPSQILRLNAWLKAYCATTNCYYLDYFSAMVDGSGLLRRGLSEDGLHPNAAGYSIMAPLAEAAIEKTMDSH